MQTKEYENAQLLDFNIEGIKGLYLIEVLLNDKKIGVIKVLKE